MAQTGARMEVGFCPIEGMKISRSRRRPGGYGGQGGAEAAERFGLTTEARRTAD